MSAAPLAPACPIPLSRYPSVTLAHGAGGRLMNQLIEELFLAALDDPLARARHDGAVLPATGRPMAVSTDAFVVKPLALPGGCIGELAVYGTANDLAMCGARPRYLTLSFILEEGLSMELLWRQVLAIRDACRVVGAGVVAGDTKVVERGKGDGIFITSTGVGEVLAPRPIAPTRVVPGDVVVVSGDLGRHGMAVMAAREGLGFEPPLMSDCGSLVAPALGLLEAGIDVHCMRDLTRGGLASALNEVAAASGTSTRLEQEALPVCAAVQSACEVYGLDPVHVANEGRFALWVPRAEADAALRVLRAFDISAGAVLAGEVTRAAPRPEVTAVNAYGTERVIDMLAGEALPRIC